MLCARLRAQPLEGGKAALPTGRDEGLSLAVGELNVVEKCITSWSGRPGARSSGSRLRWNPPRRTGRGGPCVRESEPSSPTDTARWNPTANPHSYFDHVQRARRAGGGSRASGGSCRNTVMQPPVSSATERDASAITRGAVRTPSWSSRPTDPTVGPRRRRRGGCRACSRSTGTPGG